MKSLNEYVSEYKNQIKKGDIREAYKRLMQFMMKLKTHLNSKYPEFFISGNIYQGYMDMTYFSFTPESIRKKKLKIAIVFIHETICYEVWLAGYNKQVQSRYLNLIRDIVPDNYQIGSSQSGTDYIIKHTLAANPDFNDLDTFMDKIETGTLEFIKDTEALLLTS